MNTNGYYSAPPPGYYTPRCLRHDGILRVIARWIPLRVWWYLVFGPLVVMMTVLWVAS